MNRAVFQVAHETIHCLSPSGGQNANLLEEGLATYFSIEYTRDNGHGPWLPDDGRYEEAMKLVVQLLTIDSDIIKKLRLMEPTISLITSKLLINLNPNISLDLADLLTRKFK